MAVGNMAADDVAPSAADEMERTVSGFCMTPDRVGCGARVNRRGGPEADMPSISRRPARPEQGDLAPATLLHLLLARHPAVCYREIISEFHLGTTG